MSDSVGAGRDAAATRPPEEQHTRDSSRRKAAFARYLHKHGSGTTRGAFASRVGTGTSAPLSAPVGSASGGRGGPTPAVATTSQAPVASSSWHTAVTLSSIYERTSGSGYNSAGFGSLHDRLLNVKAFADDNDPSNDVITLPCPQEQERTAIHKAALALGLQVSDFPRFVRLTKPTRAGALPTRSVATSQPGPASDTPAHGSSVSQPPMAVSASVPPAVAVAAMPQVPTAAVVQPMPPAAPVVGSDAFWPHAPAGMAMVYYPGHAMYQTPPAHPQPPFPPGAHHATLGRPGPPLGAGAGAGAGAGVGVGAGAGPGVWVAGAPPMQAGWTVVPGHMPQHPGYHHQYQHHPGYQQPQQHQQHHHQQHQQHHHQQHQHQQQHQHHHPHVHARGARRGSGGATHLAPDFAKRSGPHGRASRVSRQRHTTGSPHRPRAGSSSSRGSGRGQGDSGRGGREKDYVFNKSGTRRFDQRHGPMSASIRTDRGAVVASANLVQCVLSLSPRQTHEEAVLRYKVMATLEQALSRWVRNELGAAGLSHLAHAKRVCALVETGSSALGLRERGTDLDVVCFVNDHVRLRRFLQHLPDVLMDGPGVTQALAIEGRVGHLELIIYELHVDLLLARLPRTDMPERDTTTWLLRESYRLISGAIQGSIPISDEPDAVHEGPEGEVHGAGGADRELAAGVTMQTLRSCSSALQPYAMLASMPNLGVYRLVLRAVRLWAKRRQVYSAKFGYLGGVSWACLVAYVCSQQPPNAQPAEVLLSFFETWCIWVWKRRPVSLTTVDQPEAGFPRPAMRVVPPVAMPGENVTHTVTNSTLYHLRYEFMRGRYLARCIVSELYHRRNVLAGIPMAIVARRLLHHMPAADVADVDGDADGRSRSRSAGAATTGAAGVAARAFRARSSGSPPHPAVRPANQIRLPVVARVQGGHAVLGRSVGGDVALDVAAPAGDEVVLVKPSVAGVQQAIAAARGDAAEVPDSAVRVIHRVAGPCNWDAPVERGEWSAMGQPRMMRWHELFEPGEFFSREPTNHRCATAYVAVDAWVGPYVSLFAGWIERVESKVLMFAKDLERRLISLKHRGMLGPRRRLDPDEPFLSVLPCVRRFPLTSQGDYGASFFLKVGGLPRWTVFQEQRPPPHVAAVASYGPLPNMADMVGRMGMGRRGSVASVASSESGYSQLSFNDGSSVASTTSTFSAHASMDGHSVAGSTRSQRPKPQQYNHPVFQEGMLQHVHKVVRESFDTVDYAYFRGWAAHATATCEKPEGVPDAAGGAQAAGSLPAMSTVGTRATFLRAWELPQFVFWDETSGEAGGGGASGDEAARGRVGDGGGSKAGVGAR